MWTDEIERAAMQRELGRLRQRPAQTRGGKTEGRKRRHRHRLARIDVPQQDRADAVNEWIARCEHADLPAALRQHLLDRALERASPRPRDAADERGGKNKMPLAAKHHLCRLDKVSSDRRQALDPVLADADDGQPAARRGSLARKRVTERHATHPHSRRHDGSATAGGTPGRTRRRGRNGFARGPHRGAGHACSAGADRRIRGRRGPWRISHGRTRRRAYRCDASLRRHHLGQCGGCGGSHAVAAAAAAVKALGEASRRVFLALGKREIRTFAQAPQHHYLVRSVEPVDPPLAVPHASYVTGRGPFTEADDRALLAAHAIDLVIARNSGATATYGKIAAARALGLSVILLRRPAKDAVPTVETVEDAVSWLYHALALRGV